MAIELEELFESRQASVSSNGYTETRNYHIKGEGDPSEVLIELKPDLGSAHPVFPNTILTGIDIEPVEAEDVLKVKYSYEDQASGGGGGDRAGRNANGETWVFDMTAQSKSINYVESNNVSATESYQLVASFFNTITTEVASDTLQIGDNNGDPVGVDVYRPSGSIRVNKIYELAEINKAFREKLYVAQNTLNAAPWLGGEFDTKEVLFLGSSINYDYTAGTASVDYNFLFGKTRDEVVFKLLSKTATADNPTQNLTLLNVRPFDYIWMRYPEVSNVKKSNDPASGTEYRKFPTHLYRASLYVSSDFEQLGLIGPE